LRFTVMILLFPGIVLANFAAGNLSLDGKNFRIRSVRAKTKTNIVDKSKKDVVILFTDQPVEGADFSVPQLTLDAQSGTIHGVQLLINPAGVVYGLMILGQPQTNGSNLCEFSSEQFDLSFVKGRVYTDGEQEAFRHTYEFDLQFEADVIASFDANSDVPALTLPQGGGEPGKAYMDFDKAVQSGSIDGLKKFATNDQQVAMLEGPAGKKFVQMQQKMRPVNIKILSGSISGDHATLTVQGTNSATNASVIGTVSMILIKSSWRVEKEEWQRSPELQTDEQ
ncbi:MAG: hypothetical protein C5B54_03330, partial [Acidobacteria bacterium]